MRLSLPEFLGAVGKAAGKLMTSPHGRAYFAGYLTVSAITAKARMRVLPSAILSALGGLAAMRAVQFADDLHDIAEAARERRADGDS